LDPLVSPLSSHLTHAQQSKGEKVGLIKVRLFRPFRVDKMLDVLPESVKRISVLDRTKEAGAVADPLYLDTFAAVNRERQGVEFFAGRYGLGSKEFTPSMALSVYENMREGTPKHHFVVGINDDVGNTSLPAATEEFDVLPKGTSECMFWGLGADGTVGANHTAIEMIVKEGKQFGQGYFSYSAHKSGGLTISHLRFGPEKFQAPYLIQTADYVACHFTGYIEKYGARLIRDIKDGGIFMLNSPWDTTEEMEANLPASMKQLLARRNIRVFNLNANKVAKACNMGSHINMIMQAAFFHVSKVLPSEEALDLLKKECDHMFGKAGEEVLKNNKKAIDESVTHLKSIDYDMDKWANASADDDVPIKPRISAPITDIVKDVVFPMADLKGDDLPVSTFSGSLIGGKLPPGVTKYEKRGIAAQVPIWDEEECSQCNKCATVCPHGAIRPFLLSKSAGEVAAAPDTFTSVKAKAFGVGKKVQKDFEFSIQVSAFDCTGCTLCSRMCPDGALEMVPFKSDLEVADESRENWAYAMTLPERNDMFGPDNKQSKTLKAQQFKTPLMEFSGACAGCAETPIVKLITQMYGDQMIIANATGCSSIWAGSYPMNPYTVNEKGHGPAWGNSLFEDNAEYGFGMYVGSSTRRLSLRERVKEGLDAGEAGPLTEPLKEWEQNFFDLAGSKKAATEIKGLLKEVNTPFAAEIAKEADMLAAKSQWIFGGDGWAYDIGYGGLDHVLASGENVNVVVFDTEVYSNTGGQCSKSTPRGGVAKFSAFGKPTAKKDLGKIAMTYGNVYVASVSMGADESHLVKVMEEAASYDGPSLVLSYSPCIAHGLKGGLDVQLEQSKHAVDSGYWLLYRYDPRRTGEGLNPFQLDSDPNTELVSSFLDKETRFTSLKKAAPELAEVRLGGLQDDLDRRAADYRSMAEPFE
jgi:pyruvate-ferredoxin/flavodoxin oxidoreductase